MLRKLDCPRCDKDDWELEYIREIYTPDPVCPVNGRPQTSCPAYHFSSKGIHSQERKNGKGFYFPKNPPPPPKIASYDISVQCTECNYVMKIWANAS